MKQNNSNESSIAIKTLIGGILGTTPVLFYAVNYLIPTSKLPKSTNIYETNHWKFIQPMSIENTSVVL